MKRFLFLSLIALTMTGCTCCSPEKRNSSASGEPDAEQPQTSYYERYVEFGDAGLEQKIDMVARLVPTPQQLQWQRWELTAFIHFTVNTFTGLEWGTGKESPDVFAPTEIDTDQWVEILRDAGFKMVMLTAKHHDGFCLWPTETTVHSVAHSKWMDGKGDVMEMLRRSCDKYGLKLGVYVSPWDRNAESYGKGKAYDDFFVAQITELLTRYGEIAEVWFDGANGSEADGKSQTYDWPRYIKAVKELQPHAVTAVMGDDIRWVGNEEGKGRDAEWSPSAMAPASTPLKNPSPAIKALGADSPDLGSRRILAEAKEMYWYPSEVDVSIRPGWFYHAKEDGQVKSLEKLQSIYFTSVGYNSVLLLNVPPDRRGRIHPADEQRLREFGAWIRATFSQNAVKDGDTVWTAAAGGSKEFDVSDTPFNVVMLQEDISKGQRVERFKVAYSTDGTTWNDLAAGTTIGHKCLIRLDAPKTARKIRVTIDEARTTANMSHVGLFHSK